MEIIKFTDNDKNIPSLNQHEVNVDLLVQQLRQYLQRISFTGLNGEWEILLRRFEAICLEQD